MSEETNPIEPIPATPREQFDTLLMEAQQAFVNAKLTLAGQEGLLQGLMRAKELLARD